uniref:Uncharacterized protein n=1 Tax=Nelumbo nucifera TaxID=4432 RepID=A0A822XQR0_NELNU|nr:TPA_asm: hypothetical protein HUJ06_024140 [Nelumbo nucifera]
MWAIWGGGCSALQDRKRTGWLVAERILHSFLKTDPPEEDFPSADLNWIKFEIAEHRDDVTLIPYDQVHIERGRKRPKGILKTYKSDEYLEHRLLLRCQPNLVRKNRVSQLAAMSSWYATPE